MSVQTNIEVGIYTRAVGAANDFRTSIGSRFYFHEAPQSPTFPYAVAFLFYNPQGRDSETLFENVRLQIQIFQNPDGSSPEAIEAIADKCMAQFDNSEGGWTVSNYTLIRIDRESNNMVPIEENIKRYQIDYLLEFQGT